MVLSATQAHLAADAAKASGLHFVPLVDGRLSELEWQSAISSLSKTYPADAAVLAATEPLCSPKLIEKDAYAHFPTAFVQQNGQIHPNRLIGAMPIQFWQKGIEERLKVVPQVSQPLPKNALDQCIPQNQFIALNPQLVGLDDDQKVALGAYERISPDGRFVLRSYSGRKLTAVSVVELPPTHSLITHSNQLNSQKIYQTPFSNEAFPVQGSWRYLVDTNGEHYTFKSILVNNINARPLFRGGMDGFYAAASEASPTYPQRESQKVLIRSLSWPNPSSGGSSINTDTQGVGMLTSRTITVDAATNRMQEDSGRVNLCLNRFAQDGMMYALPMISVDGQEFAALPQNPVDGLPTMRIYSFGVDGKQCEPRGQFTSQSGKVIFGYSTPEKKYADVAYEYRGQIWWVQRNTGAQTVQLLPLNLAPWDNPNVIGTATSPVYKAVTANAFPGFTRDGRIIYAANWMRCTGADLNKDCLQEGGYVVSDPFQSNAYRNQLLQNKTLATKNCITLLDVAKERSTFAEFHGISN